jgi:hypothetical protein
MNPYKKIALMVIRLLGAGGFLIGVMNLSLYWFKNHHDKTQVNVGRCLLLSIPLVIGLLLLVKSSALAHRLTRDFDE